MKSDVFLRDFLAGLCCRYGQSRRKPKESPEKGMKFDKNMNGVQPDQAEIGGNSPIKAWSFFGGISFYPAANLVTPSPSPGLPLSFIKTVNDTELEYTKRMCHSISLYRALLRPARRMSEGTLLRPAHRTGERGT